MQVLIVPALLSQLLLPGPGQVPPGTGSLGQKVNALLGSAELSPGHSPAPVPELQSWLRQGSQHKMGQPRVGAVLPPGVRSSPGRAILSRHQVGQ